MRPSAFLASLPLCGCLHGSTDLSNASETTTSPGTTTGDHTSTTGIEDTSSGNDTSTTTSDPCDDDPACGPGENIETCPAPSPTLPPRTSGPPASTPSPTVTAALTRSRIGADEIGGPWRYDESFTSPSVVRRASRGAAGPVRSLGRCVCDALSLLPRIGCASQERYRSQAWYIPVGCLFATNCSPPSIPDTQGELA